MNIENRPILGHVKKLKLYCIALNNLDCDTVLEFLPFLSFFTHVQQQLTVICKADTFSYCLEEKQMREIGTVFSLTGVELLPNHYLPREN